MNRMQMLREMLVKTPEEPFIHYAIALEYLSQQEIEQALDVFQNLVNQRPDYLPTYYQLGKLYEQLGEPVKANGIYAAGIKLAGQYNELKTMRELSEAKELLEF